MAKRHSDFKVFVCWSEFGTLLRSIHCKSMEYKAKSVSSRRNLKPVSHSEWSEFGTENGARQVNLLAGIIAANLFGSATMNS